MRSLALFPLALLLGACSSLTPYVEYTHTSSIPNGIPFNDRPEIQVDQVRVGATYYHPSGTYIRGSLGYNLGSSELIGRDPWGTFTVGYELR